MTVPLEARDLVKRFGGLAAVDGVSIELAEREIMGLIGPNGSGKTTLLSLLAGTQRATSGEIVVAGQRIRGGARAFVHAGVGRTFQSTRLFSSWSLRDGMHLAIGERPSARAGSAVLTDAEIADLLGLEPVLDEPCSTLTSVDQRLGMVACALATAPQVLLLDEPAVGMDTSEMGLLATAIRRVRAELGVAVIVVDHNMHFLMPLADRVVVMAAGRILAAGTPSEVRADHAVIATYLGS